MLEPPSFSQVHSLATTTTTASTRLLLQPEVLQISHSLVQAQGTLRSPELENQHHFLASCLKFYRLLESAGGSNFGDRGPCAHVSGAYRSPWVPVKAEFLALNLFCILIKTHVVNTVHILTLYAPHAPSLHLVPQWEASSKSPSANLTSPAWPSGDGRSQDRGGLRLWSPQRAGADWAGKRLASPDLGIAKVVRGG